MSDEKKLDVKEELKAKDEAKKEEAKLKAKEDAKAELLKEQKEEADVEADKRDKKIKEIQKKKRKTDEDKAYLKRELLVRAKANSLKPRDLDKLYPSQMTLEEMEKYCKTNEIKTKKDDTTVTLRLRIKAFRNPAQAERLRLLEQRPLENKIIR